MLPNFIHDYYICSTLINNSFAYDITTNKRHNI